MNFKRIVNIDFRRCGIGLWKSRYFVLLIAVLGAVLGVLAAVFAIPKDSEYTATANVYCISYGSYAESVSGTDVMRTYSGIIKSRRVAEHAAALIADPNITAEDVYEQISVDSLYLQGMTYVYENDTPIISMHAVDENEYYAVSVVNAVADAFVQEVNSLSDTEAVRVLDYAINGQLTYNAMQTCFIVVLLGAIVGCILGCIIVLGKVVFTDRVMSVDDAGLYGQMKVIGIIPQFESSRRA